MVTLERSIGTPSSTGSGKRFRIPRLTLSNTMNFSAKAPRHADRFQTAVVYVYTEKGKLLLEQDFAAVMSPVGIAIE